MHGVSLLGLIMLFTGCSGTSAPDPASAPAPAPVEAPAVEPAQAWKILAPSPLELEQQVRDAGISASMADLVPAQASPMPSADDKDKVALWSGVLFAHTLLGGRSTDKAVFLGQVRALRGGMAAIGTGQGLLNTMDRSIEQIENDTAAREDFLNEIDAQVTSSVPEDGWGPNDTTGPLLQAGAWLAGIHVVSQAIVRSGDAAAADALLKRPEVADFFLKYVQGSEGADKVGPLSQAVAGALSSLKDISGRDTVGIEGAKEAAEVTGSLLKLL